jgi:hypothetical protein
VVSIKRDVKRMLPLDDEMRLGLMAGSKREEHPARKNRETHIRE